MVPGYPKDVIITTGVLAGLGDHFLNSTLARRFKEEGHNVLLDQDTFARNDETLDIIWRRNPHIDGLTDRKPNAGYIHQGAFYDELQKYPEGANLEVMERVHGFGPPYSIAPEMYYEPQPYHQDLSNKILWDWSSLSSTITDDGWRRFMEKMVERFGVFNDDGPDIVVCQQLMEVGGIRQMSLPMESSSIGIRSIYQYADMIAGCRAWVGSEAGGQALAAAIRGPHTVWEYAARPEVVSLMAVGTRNSLAFCYRGVNYRSSRECAGFDYLNAAEVQLHRYHVSAKINNMARLSAWREKTKA